MALGFAAAPASAANEARPAVAPANQASVAQLNEEGAAFYAARDYRRAIEKFIQAYAIDEDPNLLFNIARCYEELGEIDAAIEKYENFLKTPGADTRGRQRARESLATLRASKETPSADATPATGSASPTEEEPQASAATPRAAEESNLLPWLTLGGSVAFAALGTTFYLLGAGDHSEVTDAPGYGDPNVITPITRRDAEELADAGDTKKLIGGISFGLAGALAATYVVLLVTGDESSAESEPSLGFSLLPSPEGTSVAVQGSF
jgi:tetratricopeptide (TPR) repeat protein